MKTLNNFGAWVLSNGVYVGAIFGTLIGGLIAFNNPKSVSLDAKHWECTLAIPDGIESRCTEYHYRGYVPK